MTVEKATLNSYDEHGELIVSVTIEGKTEMPFWKHDLKFRAAKALLNTIEKKDYDRAHKHEEYYAELDELQKLVDALREW